MNSIDDEWMNFLKNPNNDNYFDNSKMVDVAAAVGRETPDKTEYDIPKCQDLYISTKTKVLFLNKTIDIQTIFWDLPVI